MRAGLHTCAMTAAAILLGAAVAYADFVSDALKDLQAYLKAATTLVGQASAGLDKADFPWGILQMRFNHASDFPEATVTKVPVAEVRKHLPDDTPVVTPRNQAAAKKQAAARQKAAQHDELFNLADDPAETKDVHAAVHQPRLAGRSLGPRLHDLPR